MQLTPVFNVGNMAVLLTQDRRSVVFVDTQRMDVYIAIPVQNAEALGSELLRFFGSQVPQQQAAPEAPRKGEVF